MLTGVRRVRVDLKPPEGLAPPGWTEAWLGDRDEVISRHGFTESELGTGWWNRELSAAGLGQFRIRLVPKPDGTVSLTRQDLFDLAALLDDDAADDAYLDLLWHVLSWGSGTSRRNNRQRVSSFVSPQRRARHVDLLRQAATAARSGDVTTAYRCLIRPGGGRIPGLGPAFFTKYLYFIGAGAPGHRCLILDARVARNLNEAGWKTMPRGSFNWYTQSYVAYCDLLARWARDTTACLGKQVAADQFERALFEGPRYPMRPRACE